MIQFPNTDNRQVSNIMDDKVFNERIFGKPYKIHDSSMMCETIIIATGILEYVSQTHVVLVNVVIDAKFFKKYICRNKKSLEFLEIFDEEYQELVEGTKDLVKKKTKAK